ncbi:MAG: hypothetical protein QMC83_08055 [Thermodesulfovibrionales bacterium]|nr:hypothetical protein [Thermodesulfovibrionales bacterium]
MIVLNSILERCALLRDFYHDKMWFENLLKYIDLQINIENHIKSVIDTDYISTNSVIEEGASIKSPVIILDKVKVLSGAYIEGPVIIGEKCKVGPNCHIRKNTLLLNSVIIGQGAEIKESILSGGCKVSHFSYIGNSLLGKNVNISGGVITSVRRFDNQNIKLRIHEEVYDTKKYKFGAVIGDNVQIGIGVLIYPGCIIKPNTTVKPGTIVKQNII